MINCPNCFSKTKTLSTRYNADNIAYRRRECISKKCKKRISTYEVISPEDDSNKKLASVSMKFVDKQSAD